MDNSRWQRNQYYLYLACEYAAYFSAGRLVFTIIFCGIQESAVRGPRAATLLPLGGLLEHSRTPRGLAAGTEGRASPPRLALPFPRCTVGTPASPRPPTAKKPLQKGMV